MKTYLLATAVAALTAANGASAAITVYTDQAAFLAAISAAGTDTFDDLQPTQTGTPLNRTAGVYGYQASAAPNSDFFPGTDDGTDIFLSTNNRFDTITFDSFTGGVRGAGGLFFGSDVFGESTPATAITLIATDGSGSVTQVVLAPTTTTFRGFVSDGALTSLAVSIGDEAGVWPSINNLVLGAAGGPRVPEPATWAMMIAGFAMAGAALRLRANTIALA